MKKIFAILLTIGICMGMFIPVQAESPMTVIGESTTVVPGEKFEIDISVENNTGFAYLKIRLDYQSEVFTFHSNESVSNSAELVLAAGETLISWDSSANYSSDAVIGKFYFTASEVSEGDYTIGITVVECYDINTNDVITSTVNSNVKIQTVEAVSTIDSADMVLGSDITVNYYATLAASHIGAQMKFTVNEQVTFVDGIATGNENEYMFSFRGIAPQCMGDNIRADLVLGEQVLDTKTEYSVRTYCLNTLSKTANDLGISAEKYAALRTLIADMLEYGAKAQIYRNYKTNTLVNQDITGKTDFVELTSNHEKYIDESGLDGVEMTAAGVYFDYTNSLYLKFTAPNMTEDDFYILAYNEATDEEIEYLLSDCTLISEETSTYLLILDPCLATGYNDLYYIDLYAPNVRGRVVVQQSLEYSIASYVYSMQNKTDGGELTAMANLARSTYNYGLSAIAYNKIAN